ncbi:hypothetical protein JOB18_048329 [Solea senegalensis]|uniref:Ciliary neurotrophic factor n=2 Tax=Solea senegalensis TaxID=28829 RepID=A0AAV6QMU2_SOLSE|nr:hypothetical protein JOB18_048329 [Solea senegalensis]
MILDFQWRPVFSAPVHTSCRDIDNAKSLAALLGEETNELLDEYISVHGFRPDYVTDEILDYRIVGVTISEKLQDVYVKNLLFNLHIAKVNEYHKEITGNSESLSMRLFIVKERLSMHLAKIQIILGSVCPEIPLPPTPGTLQLHHDHSYAKKEYGLSVIVTLRDWHKQVWQVLEEAKNLCDQQDARILST